MICWYCHWGWAKPIADIFLKAKEALGGNDELLIYGVGHIIWADENFSLAHVNKCLSDWPDWVDSTRDLNKSGIKDVSLGECLIVRYALQQLADIIESIPEVEPEDYDGEHPENYPPLGEVVKV